MASDRVTTQRMARMWFDANDQTKREKVASQRADGTIDLHTNTYGPLTVDELTALHAQLGEILTDLAAEPILSGLPGTPQEVLDGVHA